MPPTRCPFTVTADNDVPVQKRVPSVSRSPGTSGSRTSFSPLPSLCPNTTMKGLSALRRIKHRLSDDFDAFCRTIFGQTPPPAGKRFFFLLRSYSAHHTIVAPTENCHDTRCSLSIDPCFVFFSTSRVFDVVLKRPDWSLALNGLCTFYLVVDYH